MGTSPRTTLAIGALALVLCALVAATSDGLSWVRPEPGSAEQSVTDEDEQQPADEREDQEQGEAPAGEADEEDGILPWVPPLDLVLVLLAALVVGAALVAATRLRLLFRRRRRTGGVSPRGGAEAVDAGPEDVEPTPELAAAVHAGLDDLGYGDPRNAIVAAWLRLEDAVESELFERDPADTPTEFVRRVLSAYRLDATAIDRLADRYREARFSEHPVTEAHRAEARASLAALLRDLPAWQR